MCAGALAAQTLGALGTDWAANFNTECCRCIWLQEFSAKEAKWAALTSRYNVLVGFPRESSHRHRRMARRTARSWADGND